MKDSGNKLISQNKKARRDYRILDTWEVGIELGGAEVKVLREGHCSLGEGYAQFVGNELYLNNVDIPPYKNAGYVNHEPKRLRKLLMHRKQLTRIQGKVATRGFTLIPLSIYFKNGWAKIELGLAVGRTQYEKRDKIRKREDERELRNGAGT